MSPVLGSKQAEQLGGTYGSGVVSLETLKGTCPEAEGEIAMCLGRLPDGDRDRRAFGRLGWGMGYARRCSDQGMVDVREPGQVLISFLTRQTF